MGVFYARKNGVLTSSPARLCLEDGTEQVNIPENMDTATVIYRPERVEALVSRRIGPHEGL